MCDYARIMYLHMNSVNVYLNQVKIIYSHENIVQSCNELFDVGDINT